MAEASALLALLDQELRDGLIVPTESRPLPTHIDNTTLPREYTPSQLSD